MARPVEHPAAKPGSSRPERSSKEEEGAKGSSWFSGLWGEKSKADEASPEPFARQDVVGQRPKTKDYHPKKTGEWVVTDSKQQQQQQQQQPPRDAGGGETEEVTISPLDAALKYNDLLHRKNDKLVKKLARLSDSVKAKDQEIARLKKSLQSAAAESGHLSQASDVSPSLMSKEVMELEVKLQASESASERATEAALSSVGGSSDEAAGLKVEVKRLQEQVNQYGHAVRSANFDKQRLSKNLERYRQQFERVAKEKSVMEESEQARSDLEQKNVALQAQVANLTESASERATEATLSSVGGSSDEAAGLKVEVKRLQEQVNQYGQAVRSANFDKQRLSKNLESYRQQLERVAKENSVIYEESEQAHSDLEQKNVMLQDQVVNLTESVSTAQNKATQLAAKLEGLDQELEWLRRQNQELLGETEALRINVEDLRRQDEKQKQEISNQAQQFQLQRNGIESLQKENGNLQTQLQMKQEVEPLHHGAEKGQEMERDKEELARYRIMSYQPLKGDSFAGAGSYGSVHRVQVNNIPCIAKRILDILVGRNREEGVSNEEKLAIQLKFQKECVLLSRMRHPNIVQFMGVHYHHQDPLDLTLIMEFLPMDLEKCLKKYPNLPLPIKLSILLDVSYGVLHLHNASIIHRDLSAANVLLTPDMRAKITDFGVSKILEVHPLRMSKQSTLPGALGYMPPEALWEIPEYGTKLDIFSFGVVALFVAVQQYPQFYETAGQETVDIQIKKRQKWIRMLPGKDCRCLHDLIIQCLQDKAAQRPTTERVNLMLKQLSQDHPREITDIVHLEQERHQKKELAGKAQQEKQYIKQVEDLRRQDEKQKQDITALQRQNGDLQHQYESLWNEAENLQKRVANLRQQLQMRLDEIQRLHEGHQEYVDYVSAQQKSNQLIAQAGARDVLREKEQLEMELRQLKKWMEQSGFSLDQLPQENPLLVPPRKPHPLAQQPSQQPGYYNLEVITQRPQQQDLVNPKPAQQQSQQPERGYENLGYSGGPVVQEEQIFGTAKPTNPERGYENLGYSGGPVVQEEQIFGTAKPTNLPMKEELYFRDPQGSGQERLQAYQASPRDQGYSYPKQGSGTPPVVSPGIITDTGNQPAPRAVQSDTQIPYQHHQQQQHEVQSPIPRPLPPGPSTTSQASAQPFENKLQAGIDEDIAEVANDMGGSGDLVRQVTNVNAPYDPDLICPMCVKHFRIGEIQKYRKHVLECGGTAAAASI